MLSLWEVLKTSKGLPAPDGFTALFACSLSDTYTLAEISGIPPLNLGEIVEIVDYTIYGNTYQSDGVSPDTPQEVVGCGDRTGNLIDTKNSASGSMDGNGNIYENSDARTTQMFEIKGAENYVITSVLESDWVFHYRLVFYDENRTFISREIPTGRTATFTAPETARYIRVSYNNEIINLMLNSGSTPLPYEPYGYKVDVECRGKNLFDISTIEAGRIDDNGEVGYISQTSLAVSGNTITFSTTSSWRGFVSDYIEINGVIPIISYGSFTSNENAILNGFLHYYDADKQYLGNTSEHLPNTKYVRISFQSDVIVTNAVVSDIQVELGTEATSYEPYHEPITTPLYLDSPLYKIGDYADSLGSKEEVRVIKELILTGEEEWKKSTAYAGNFYTRDMLNLRSLGDDAYCTHATQVKIPITTEKFVYGTFATESLYSNSAALNLFIGQSEWTVDNFKAYLKEQYNNGTPITVYYVLAEPETKTVEPVEIPTLDGTTVIDVDTEVKPSNLKITYKSRR